MKVKTAEKLMIVKAVRRKVERTWAQMPPERGPVGQYCLVWALATVGILRAYGVADAHFQAGTAYWPRLRPEQDDGLETTMIQFGYEFAPDKFTGNSLLPEMHCWAAIGRDTIVDVTTGFQQENALRLGGFDWPGDPLPPYLWANLSDIPAGWVYRPRRDAVELAMGIVKAGALG